MGNLQTQLPGLAPGNFWSFEPSTKRGDYNEIEINSLQFTCATNDRKNQYQIIVFNSIIPPRSLNIPAKARELSAVLLWLSGRENGKMLFVLLCFFWLYFSLVTISTSGLQLSASAELMKSPEGSDWSTHPNTCL